MWRGGSSCKYSCGAFRSTRCWLVRRKRWQMTDFLKYTSRRHKEGWWKAKLRWNGVKEQCSVVSRWWHSNDVKAPFKHAWKLAVYEIINWYQQCDIKDNKILHQSRKSGVSGYGKSAYMRCNIISYPARIQPKTGKHAFHFNMKLYATVDWYCVNVVKTT
jgi:hypothetical protein